MSRVDSCMNHLHIKMASKLQLCVMKGTIRFNDLLSCYDRYMELSDVDDYDECVEWLIYCVVHIVIPLSWEKQGAL